jgi:DNA-binding ferritin-like protein
MTKFEKSMEQIFDVAPVEVIEKEALPAVIEKENTELREDLKADYDAVSNNYEQFIEKGKDAIDDILEIARESEHPRAFEVAATMIKNVTEANEKLILLQKQMRDMKKGQKETSKTTIDKAIFVGSTAELSKLLKGKE